MSLGSNRVLIEKIIDKKKQKQFQAHCTFAPLNVEQLSQSIKHKKMCVTLLQKKGMNHCYGIYSLFPGQSEQLLLCTDWWQAPLCFSVDQCRRCRWGTEMGGKIKLLGESSGSESPQDRVAPSGQCPTWHWCTVSIPAAEGIQMVQKREDEMEWVRGKGGFDGL